MRGLPLIRVLCGRRRLATALALWVSLLMLTAPVLVVGAQTPSRDVVDTAVAAGQFTTLARALQAAGLVDTLKGAGPYTVFAPTDAAFNKLPAGTLDQLLANPQQLRAVLTYHVVPGRVTAAQVAQLQSATTVQGEAVRISASGGTVRLNTSATVTQADVAASNGVIHVIDTVLLPPSMTQMPRSGAGGGAGQPLPIGLISAAALLVGLVATGYLVRARAQRSS